MLRIWTAQIALQSVMTDDETVLGHDRRESANGRS